MIILLGITDNKDILFLEAYLLLKNKGINIDEIKVIRTKDIDKSYGINDFFLENNVKYDITEGREIGLLRDEKDYNKVEDFVFRWFSGITENPDEIYVFIGGGHKLHAIALLRSAFLFGAKEIFHMFFSGKRGTEPTDLEQVKTAIINNKLLYASLGNENGWPALKTIQNNIENFRQTILNITGSIASRNVDDVNEYPFECLNLLPQTAINWLNQPLEEKDIDWVLSLPKTELHCHLGGFATHEQLLMEVRANAINELPTIKNIGYPENWPLPDEILPLEEYMKRGDNNGSYILKDIGCLRKQVELLYKNFIGQNISYAEVRCSPYNYAGNEYSGKDILDIIIKEFDKQMRKYDNKCHVNLLIIATRNKSKEYIQNSLDLAVKYETNIDRKGKCRIVGVDLAGYEDIKTRAKYFEQDFEIVHRKGLDITIHAGENDDSESIWQAIYKLNTRRIGHGLNLYQDKNLMRSVINRKIGVEMCPYANYQIKGFYPMKGIKMKYPLLDYLNAGIQVCINTDNIGISNANITDNFMLLTKLNPGITRMQLLRLIRNGILQAFVGYDFRLQMLKEFNNEIFNIILNMNFVNET